MKNKIEIIGLSKFPFLTENKNLLIKETFRKSKGNQTVYQFYVLVCVVNGPSFARHEWLYLDILFTKPSFDVLLLPAS